MQYLIYGLAACIFLQGIICIVLFDRFYHLTLRYSRYSVREAETIPKYIRKFFHVYTQQLTDMGFNLCKYLEIETTIAGEKYLALLFYNQHWHTYALAKFSEFYNNNNPIDFIFETFFDDGILLLTINASNNTIVGDFPATILQEEFVITIQQQWKIHQNKVGSLIENKMPKILSPELFIEAIASHEAAYINSLYVNKKIVKQPKSDLFNLTINMVIESVWKSNSVNPINSIFFAPKKKTVKFPEIIIPIPLEIELFKTRQRTEANSNQNNYLLKIGILLASLALFILSTRLYLREGSPWLLIGILFVHELGHLMAMKLYKYSNTSIFFLPFFGAAVLGHKDNVTITQRVIVLLSGAVPSIILGLFLILIIPENLYTITNSSLIVNWIIGINCLNLLPVFPLDGGKIINLLLFSLHPYGEVTYKIFTVIFLLVTTILLKEPILLSITILLIISIPQNWKIARILNHLPSSTKSEDKIDKQLSDIFKAIALANYQNLQFDDKYRLVKEILQRKRQPSTSWRNRLCLITIYLVCLIGGIWAMKIA